MATHLSDEEAVRLADLNYAHSFRLVGGCAIGGSVREGPGILSAITGPIAWLNVTVVHEKLADPASAISRAIDFYRQARVPFVMRIRVGFDPDTQQVMQELGLQTADQMPGMVLNPVAEIPAPPNDLTIADWDAASLPTHNEIIAASFGMPLQLANDLMTPALLNSATNGYLGYVHGRPVATSALIASDGVADVYNVATLPAYRGRGIGEAMTWHAVRKGVEAGCVIGSLQASAMGQPVYARMGFRTIAPYESYILPPKPEAG
jgi:ribosomal protein S18 acetylase RimI-like enzyme